VGGEEGGRGSIGGNNKKDHGEGEQGEGEQGVGEITITSSSSSTTPLQQNGTTSLPPT